MTHEFEVHQRCEELYVLEGRTLEETAGDAGVPLRTVEAWSAAEGWAEKRREYRRALGEIKRNTVLYRLNLLKEAMHTLHPQNAFAWATVERVAASGSGDGKQERPQAEEVAEAREIRTAQDAVEALQEALDRKIRGLLSRPDELNLKALKDMKQAMSLLDEMRSRWTEKPDEARRKGLSDETVEDIRRRILGIS